MQEVIKKTSTSRRISNKKEGYYETKRLIPHLRGAVPLSLFNPPGNCCNVVNIVRIEKTLINWISFRDLDWITTSELCSSS